MDACAAGFIVHISFCSVHFVWETLIALPLSNLMIDSLGAHFWYRFYVTNKSWILDNNNFIVIFNQKFAGKFHFSSFRLLFLFAYFICRGLHLMMLKCFSLLLNCLPVGTVSLLNSLLLIQLTDGWYRFSGRFFFSADHLWRSESYACSTSFWMPKRKWKYDVRIIMAQRYFCH